MVDAYQQYNEFKNIDQADLFVTSNQPNLKPTNEKTNIHVLKFLHHNKMYYFHSSFISSSFLYH